MHFRHPHPWEPGYALPKHVVSEPPLRGTHTTKYKPRRSIDAPWIPSPWRTGYAYPGYLKKEPLGRGVYRTKYLPRRTVSMLPPRELDGFDTSKAMEYGALALGALAALYGMQQPKGSVRRKQATYVGGLAAVIYIGALVNK